MLDTTVWVAQGFLALFFFAAGVPKIVGRGIDRWVGFDQVPRIMTIVIGVSEVAAAVALIVPGLIDRLEWTTPLAAVGIAVISLMASGFHLRAREWLAALETVLWASLAGTIAIARWDQLATGPSLSEDLLVPVLLALVPAIIVNLVFLARATSPAQTQDSSGPKHAGSGSARR
ncbi:DoxX family protein [Actinomadura sp. WMMB 499]|uniref:DoxX family protein n=1 Tax=Actinomadura sp. WMMB 499 TaxID=1219491 RepID=UPI00159D1761|nr:DoxX family protein [Actinomadura sp. WMMB 499]